MERVSDDTLKKNTFGFGGSSDNSSVNSEESLTSPAGSVYFDPNPFAPLAESDSASVNSQESESEAESEKELPLKGTYAYEFTTNEQGLISG
jgi:hypothetical protein